MVKKLTSIILSLSIAASLFAGLSFSAFAATSDTKGNNVIAYTNGMETESTRYQWLADNGYSLQTSLIKDWTNAKTKAYYFISSQEENPTFAGVNSLTYGAVTPVEATGMDSLTKSADSSGMDVRYVNNSDLQKRMFLTYAEGSEVGVGANITGVVKDESKQFIQLNFELPAEADISQYSLSYAGAWNQTYNQPGKWKLYVADTEDGLWSEDNCVSDVDNINSTSTRVVGVNLTNAKRGKWVGLKIICAYNDGRGASNLTSMGAYVWPRLGRFSLQGTYVNTATVPEGISATTSGKANVSAVASLAGNTDKNGTHPYAAVALTADETYVGDDGIAYRFEGWYLGEDKVADTATATYILTGEETTTEFTAKYKVAEVELYDSSKYKLTGTHYAGQLTNNPIDKSLIVGKMPISAQVFNTIEGDFAVSNKPQDYTSQLSGSMQTVTSATVNNGDARFFSDAGSYKTMFLDTVTNEEGAFVSMTATDDEANQWVQFNYELDGVADIDNILFGRYYAGSKWDVGHFKLILSDTEAGLTALGAAKAVIDVNAGTQQYKANWNFEFTQNITAKYVGIRIISMYNNNYGEWTEVNLGQAYPRFTHLGVHGTYVEPIESVEGLDVTVEAEGDLPEDLVSKSEPVYGNPDKNGKYGSCNVTVTAEENYVDAASIRYIFDGWYNGDQKVSDDAEFVYNLANGSATLTAKYTIGDLTSSKYGIKDGYVRIEKGETVSSVVTGFDQDRSYIVVKNGDILLQDNDIVDRGMTVELVINGEAALTYEVVHRGDFDGQDGVTVTDITLAIDAMVNGAEATADETFRFDNGDSKLTVTDVVNARKAILGK